MSKCQPIDNLVFDSKSIMALGRISNHKKMAKILTGSVTAGVIMNIFARSGSAQSSYNISQTDWVTYAESMSAVPAIFKGLIERDVKLMIVDYQMTNQYKLKKFWEGVLDGCQ